uniref:COMM domain containing 10 n=1 Tax=Eptatretus burgeri TaxID=7764 RepID=A0A8C4QP92_EPTBU
MGFITETPRIKEAVGIANGVDEGKFPRILSRILQKLHLKDERPFSVEEEQKLQIALDLDSSHLSLLLETLAFLFEQAVFHGPKMPALEQQLLDLGLASPQIAAFLQAWVGGGRTATEALRRRALAPHSLQSVGWTLGLGLAQSCQARQQIPTAMLEMGIRSNDSQSMEKLLMEFNHKELYELYNKSLL